MRAAGAGGAVVCLTTAGALRLDRDGAEVTWLARGEAAPRDARRIAPAAGALWWASPSRRFVRFDPASGRAEMTALALPASTDVVGPFSDGAGGFLVAGADGTVLRARPGDAAFAPAGRLALTPLRCLACLPDGRAYGMCGDGIGQFFRMDLASGACAQLGAVATALAAKRYAFDFSAAVAGPDGKICFGEYDRGGHLWVYFPPLGAPAGAPAASEDGPGRGGGGN